MIATITKKKVQRSYGNHSPCDRSDNDRWDRTFTFSVTVVAAIAAMATITREGRVADFKAGVQGLDIVPGTGPNSVEGSWSKGVFTLASGSTTGKFSTVENFNYLYAKPWQNI